MNRSIKAISASAFFLALTMGGCSSADHDGASFSSKQPQTITLAYVSWASCVASTNVVQAALEEAGYQVKTMSVSGALLYDGLAQGDIDAMVCAWLPSTHKDYYAKTRDELVNLGPNMAGTRIGLVVPDYVKIHSIADLADPNVSEAFDNRIIGIDPGAGEMGVANRAIVAYELPEQLLTGSEATMIAALGNASRMHKPVVVTGWTPHWMWARWKLRYLSDPKGIFGKPENIETLVRKGLQTDAPKAYAILDRFRWSAADMSAVMAADVKPGADPKANAKAWVKAHPRQLDAWLDRPSCTSIGLDGNCVRQQN